MKNISYLILFSCTVLLTSCDPLMVYDHYQDTPDGKWGQNDIRVFKVEMPDTLNTFNILVNVRHTTDYPFSNLYVFVTITGPDGFSIKDTLEIQVTDEKGKWKGYGFGKIKNISRMYKKNIRFSHPGNYTFAIEQGTRQADIPVTDVGLRIEKFKDLR